MVITVRCNQSAISRFFLLAPSLSSLSVQQRTDVIGEPIRYALAFMEADAINRLKSGFEDPAVQSIDLKAILIERNDKGKPVERRLFEVHPTRSDTSRIQWATLPPDTLFHQVPSALSRWLVSQLRSEAGPRS
jgi:hypothetical protein